MEITKLGNQFRLLVFLFLYCSWITGSKKNHYCIINRLICAGNEMERAARLSDVCHRWHVITAEHHIQHIFHTAIGSREKIIYVFFYQWQPDTGQKMSSYWKQSGLPSWRGGRIRSNWHGRDFRENMQLFPVIRLCICLKTESVKNPYLCSETH